METIIFLIIVGILSSIFGKGKGKNNPGTFKTKTFAGKSFDDLRKMAELQRDNIPGKTGQISTGMPIKKETELQSIEKKYQELKQNPVVESSQVSRSQSLGVSNKEMDPDKVSLSRPDEKTILNGIIWAEILGEPRSKKPYLSKKN